MSKASRFLLVFAVLFFLGLCIFRIIYGGWHESMWVPLVLSILLFAGAVAKDWRMLAEFFTLRTTKHGMNMGVSILLAAVALACVNLLAIRYNQKLDWTSEKLHSLSDQSVKAVQGLKHDTEIVLLYKPDEQVQGENVQRAVSDLVAMYTGQSRKISYKAFNAYQESALAEKYDYRTGPYAIYAVQDKGEAASRVKIEQPTEEGITRALLKLGRDSKKVVYFLQGHGERSLEDTGGEGLSELKTALSVIYDAKPLTLYQVQNNVPSDAGAVAIIRPQQPLLEPELQALREYARAGGRLLIAIDPNEKQNLALLTKTFGVEFNNDYILDARTERLQRGPTLVLGTVFSKTDEITRAVEAGKYAVFMMTSSLKKAPGLPPSLMVDELVGTDVATASVPTLDLKGREVLPNGPQALIMSVKGRLPAAGEIPEGKDFAAVIAGDSDFIANKLIQNSVNNDVSLNTFSSLLQDQDLISIRPKQPKGTLLEITDMQFASYVLFFLLGLPLLMFFAGGFTWWRRRSA